MRRVAIVGAALSDCGRVDDRTAFHLHHQATDADHAAVNLNSVDFIDLLGQAFIGGPPIVTFGSRP